MFIFSRKGKESMKLADVTERLNELRIPISLVFTPTNLDVEKKRFLNSDDYNPKFQYKIVANKNDQILKGLSSLKEISNVDPRISEFYIQLIEEKKEASDLMHSVGINEKVTDISKKRFRFPSSKLFRNATRIIRGKTDKYNLVDGQKIEDSRWMEFDEIKDATELFLREIGLDDWTVQPSKKITKNGVKTGIKRREVRMDPGIKKRALNLRKTIVHEIGTHALRAHNGFLTGYDALGKPNLPDYLDIEEGLATWNEENMGVLSYSQLRKRALSLWSVYIGEYMTFRELFNALLGIVPRLEAFDIAYRVKRGMGNTVEPGIYCKDVVYFRGYRRVKRMLEKDASMYRKLYAGKIGFKQVSWVNDGLISKPKVVPDMELYEKAFKKAGI